MSEPQSAPAADATGAAPIPGVFLHALVNTAVANISTSFLWFALTFWVYLETRSVLATGIIGGAYMLFVAVFSMVFGSVVDRMRKLAAMRLASTVTLAAFLVGGAIFLAVPVPDLLDLGGPWFWVFAAVTLFGAVIENMRNIALSTTVTLLVAEPRHANANGMVGTVAGVGFIVTGVLSGLAVGFLGMGWVIAIAVAASALVLLDLFLIRFAEPEPDPAAATSVVDFRGAIRAIRTIPGLFALILFSTFNNLIGGVYIALMDPYGLEMFSVQLWGIVFAVAGTGFVIGGILISVFGLGRNPIRTLLLIVMLMGLLGALFTIREWWLLYAVGIWLYMAVVPFAEAAEQTVIQKVVPFESQGRVFGFAQAFESAAAPITAFLIAPIAEFVVIPALRSPEGAAAWRWLLGDGESRGIALVFLIAGLVMIVIAALAFLTPAYRRVSASYRTISPPAPAPAE